MQPDNQVMHARVTHATPGRLRLRLHPASRHPRHLGRIREHLAAQPGVTGVSANPTTGSVLVQYDRQTLCGEDLLGWVHDLGVVLHEAVEPGSEDQGEEGLSEAGRSRPATHFMSAIDRLDRRLSQSTGHTVNLRLLFPVGLFAVGLRQVLVEGLGLAQVPGYVLLWYAFDSFWKRHTDLPSEGAAALASATPATPAPGADAAPDHPPARRGRRTNPRPGADAAPEVGRV